MSITPKQWSQKDEAGTTPDANLRLESFFNTSDGYVYRVYDFLLVQEPGKEVVVYPETRKNADPLPSYTAVEPGALTWYVVLEKVDSDGARVAHRYIDFDDSMNPDFHRIKNDKPKSNIRGGHPNDNPEYVRPRGAERFDHTGDRTAQDAEIEGQRALTSRSRPSSVDMSTGSQSFIDEAQQKSQPSIQYPRDAIDAG